MRCYGNKRPFVTGNLQMFDWSSRAGGSKRNKGADWEQQQLLKLLYNVVINPKNSTNPTEQRYKNTFGHLTNFHFEFFPNTLLLNFVRLRLQDQFSPVDVEKSVAFTWIS